MINQRTIKNNVKSSASKAKNLRQLNDRDKKEILKKKRENRIICTSIETEKKKM